MRVVNGTLPFGWRMPQRWRKLKRFPSGEKRRWLNQWLAPVQGARLYGVLAASAKGIIRLD
jgi:hypothetical protein